MQKTKRAAKTGKQYAKFLSKAYQRQIKDLTREKNKVKRVGTTLTGSKSKAKKRPPRLKATGEYCSFEDTRGIGYNVVQDDVTLDWFCGAQWRKVFVKPEQVTLLGLRRLVTDISKVAGGKQANSSFAFTACRIKAVPIAWNTETGVGQLASVHEHQGNPCQLTNP